MQNNRYAVNINTVVAIIGGFWIVFVAFCLFMIFRELL